MNDWDPFYSLYSPPRPLEKTPYQLDIEVKDRKPDIVPKVGDKVKIKSREWYEKWKNEGGSITGLGTHCLTPTMSEHCGAIFEISFNFGTFFTLKGIEKGWTLAMFEEVYPQESSKVVECAKAFEALGINASALEKSLVASSAIPAIESVQGIGIATDWSKLVSDTAVRITSPQQSLFCNAGFHCQSVLKDEEPELQTIKKHRFIKLENL